MRMTPPRIPPPSPHVAIVGGGLAGLAAAASLVDRGVRITLIESRPRLGGRASSFQDPATGEMVDNCQHVSMVCCTNLADFCEKVGIADLFRRVPDVRFLSPEGKLSTLAAGRLPAPLHLAGSFLRANYLTWTERLRVAFGVACLANPKGDRPGESFESWLRRHGQTTRTIERYWGTVLISALNERLDRMDVGHARKVFLDGFLRTHDGYQMEIPLAPLGEIYGTRLERWLAEQGVEVRLTTGVKTVEVDDDGHLVGLRLRSGEAIDADFVVLAAPFDRVAGFLPPSVLDRIPTLNGLGEIRSSPITGVHLWFDRPICPYEHVVTVGRLVQWVFDHTAIQGRTADEGSRGNTSRSSSARAMTFYRSDKTEILEAVLDDLRVDLAQGEGREAELDGGS